jgi:hypothetical protein
MLIPGGAVQFFGMLLGGWVATHWPGTRCLVMVVANAICIIGSGLLVGLPAVNKVCSFSSLLRYSNTISIYLPEMISERRDEAIQGKKADIL